MFRGYRYRHFLAQTVDGNYRNKPLSAKDCDPFRLKLLTMDSGYSACTLGGLRKLFDIKRIKRYARKC